VFWRLLRRDAYWRGAGRASLVAGLLVAASLALPGAVGGYVFVAVLLAWLEVLALRLWGVAALAAGPR
jgi:type IV secretory pathway VirB3-like protein